MFLTLFDDLLAIVNNFWLTGGIEREEESFFWERKKEWNKKEIKHSDLSV